MDEANGGSGRGSGRGDLAKGFDAGLVLFLKAHIDGYTKQNGTYVRPHEDSRKVRPVIYRRHYEPRSGDQMRLFQIEPRVVHLPAPTERPKGMMRIEHKTAVEKPWVVQTPRAGKKWDHSSWDRYATEAEAHAAAARLLPSDDERAAHSAIGASDQVGAIKAELERRGYSVHRDDAKTTESKYLYVRKDGMSVKVRFSNHSKTVFLGNRSRAHSANDIDLSLGDSKPQLVSRIASLFRTVDLADKGEGDDAPPD